jgi:hypothetical protein
MRTLKMSRAEARLYRLYLDRIEAFRARPPAPDWDGFALLRE